MHILLAGQSCSGKSSFLKHLHQSGQFGFLQLIDLDDFIQQKFNPTGKDPFQDETSLKFFRQVESEALSELMHREKPSLIALGGGTLDQVGSEEIEQWERRQIYLFHFRQDALICLERAIKFERPLTKVLSKQDLSRLFLERQIKLEQIARELPAQNLDSSLKILQEFCQSTCQK